MVAVNVVDVSPWPVKSGEFINITIHGTAKSAIDGGLIAVDVYLRGAHVYTEKQQVCSIFSCPVKPGQAVVQYGYKIPGYAPSVEVNVKVSADGTGATGQTSFPLFCHEFELPISHKSIS